LLPPGLSTATLPPCSSTSDFTSARPSPGRPASGRSCGGLREQVEHMAAQFGRHADAVVADRQQHVVAVGACGQLDDAAGRRVFGGVIEHIDQHLHQPLGRR
jgi:hypothetical protein